MSGPRPLSSTKEPSGSPEAGSPLLPSQITEPHQGQHLSPPRWCHRKEGGS